MSRIPGNTMAQLPAENIVALGRHYDFEKKWINRFEWLKSHGYLLRPRYRPGWVAPWKPEDYYEMRHEERITPRVIT